MHSIHIFPFGINFVTILISLIHSIRWPSLLILAGWKSFHLVGALWDQRSDMITELSDSFLYTHTQKNHANECAVRYNVISVCFASHPKYSFFSTGIFQALNVHSIENNIQCPDFDCVYFVSFWCLCWLAFDPLQFCHRIAQYERLNRMGRVCCLSDSKEVTFVIYVWNGWIHQRQVLFNWIAIYHTQTTQNGRAWGIHARERESEREWKKECGKHFLADNKTIWLNVSLLMNGIEARNINYFSCYDIQRASIPFTHTQRDQRVCGVLTFWSATFSLPWNKHAWKGFHPLSL